MRKHVTTALSALILTAVLAPSASANSGPSSSGGVSASPSAGGHQSSFSMTAKITRFRATAAGVIADGTMSGKLRSGGSVSRDSAPVRFRVAAVHRHGRCDVLTLHLAPLYLELLGVEVKTSAINLDVYAHRGRVLGDLFCALAHARVSFPRVARLARTMNTRLNHRPLQVMAASTSLPVRTAATQPQSCQVLKLVLGPLHLDLLGLVVDLYGRTHTSPVIVTINALPNKGLLGQLLCGLAGGNGITSLSALQNLLNSLGLNLTNTQLQNLLNNLGINLSSGLTQLDLNRILNALGLHNTPTG